MLSRNDSSIVSKRLGLVWGKFLISIGAFLVLALGVGGTVAWQKGLFTHADADHPTQFIQHDFVDLSKIGSISKFRSGEGHDFSGGGETCRSMKHYFTPERTAADYQTLQNQPQTQGRQIPPAPTPETAIAIYSPVDGVITDMQSEQFPVGKQIFITPSAAKGYVIRLFHVYPLAAITKGVRVTAGQHIGDISRLGGTDISVQAGQLNGRYVSYFDVMPDTVFAAYQARGAASRSDFIFTKEYRDAHPFKCNGENFAENYASDPNSGQDVILNGWTQPTFPSGQGSQNGQPQGNTNAGGQQQNQNVPQNYGNSLPR